MAKLYKVSSKGEHIPYTVGKSLTGTARYASTFSHIGCEQSRRDDLESAFYVMLYLLKGSLPWDGIKAESKQEKYAEILKQKTSNSIDDLCKGFPSNS